MGRIRDLWILLESGAVLFDRLYEKKVNPNLFGAMMSALNSYVKLIADDEGMLSFQLNESNVTVFKKGHVLFIANTKKKEKEKKVVKDVKKIKKIFFETYSEEFSGDYLTEWDGEISKFSDFGEEIIDFLKDKENL